MKSRPRRRTQAMMRQAWSKDTCLTVAGLDHLIHDEVGTRLTKAQRFAIIFALRAYLVPHLRLIGYKHRELYAQLTAFEKDVDAQRRKRCGGTNASG